MAYIPSGLKDANFASLIEAALATRGFRSVADFIEKIHNYYEDEQDWRKLFPLSPDANPDRVFKQYTGTEFAPILATYIADDAEAPLMTNDKAGLRTGSIPRMSKRYMFDAESYETSKRLIAAGNESRGLSKAFSSFLVDNIKLISTIHQQRTFTSLQVESKGMYVSTQANNPDGPIGLQIGQGFPTDHQFKAGGVFASGGQGTKYAWSDDSANPIGDLQDLYDYGWKNRLFSNDPKRLVFRMSQALYTTFKNHATVKTAIYLWKGGYVAGSNTMVPYFRVTDNDVQEYLVGIGLPAIEVVPTYGFAPYFDSSNKTIKKAALSAFDPTKVILREKGVIGEMQWYQVTNMFSTIDNPMYYTDGGSISIQQITSTRQKSIEYTADTLCVPVLAAINRILSLDTSEAAS